MRRITVLLIDIFAPQTFVLKKKLYEKSSKIKIHFDILLCWDNEQDETIIQELI